MYLEAGETGLCLPGHAPSTARTHEAVPASRISHGLSSWTAQGWERETSLLHGSRTMELRNNVELAGGYWAFLSSAKLCWTRAVPRPDLHTAKGFSHLWRPGV